ncbi:hypothetical protein GCM10009760_16230 [Kitasatospora kazusensis]|uniref:Uncharacterized protein n=1 Tax=Kitasatospora kazusensis TaxID=407974 RepID=A0ABN2Z4F8_9ACTN
MTATTPLAARLMQSATTIRRLQSSAPNRRETTPRALPCIASPLNNQRIVPDRQLRTGYFEPTLPGRQLRAGDSGPATAAGGGAPDGRLTLRPHRRWL